MTTQPTFPRYFKSANTSGVIIRFKHSGFGTFPNTERASDIWTLDRVSNSNLWLEITALEAEELGKGRK